MQFRTFSNENVSIIDNLVLTFRVQSYRDVVSVCKTLNKC